MLSSILFKDIQLNIEKLKDNVDSLYNSNKRLVEENKELKEKRYKDKELQRMNEECNKMRDDLLRGFPISEKEQEEIEAWKEKHYKKYISDRKIKKNTGHYYTYEFCPTELGLFGTIKCSCGEEFEFQRGD